MTAEPGLLRSPNRQCLYLACLGARLINRTGPALMAEAVRPGSSREDGFTGFTSAVRKT